MKKLIFLIVFSILSACATTKSPVPELTNNGTIQSSMAKLADAAYTRSDWPESERLYLLLAKDAPDNGQYWFRLGNIYSVTNRIDAAVIAYNQSLKSDPMDPNVWFNLGMIQLKQAAYTFNSMQAQTFPENPLNEKSQNLLNGILQLLNQE